MSDMIRFLRVVLEFQRRYDPHLPAFISIYDLKRCHCCSTSHSSSCKGKLVHDHVMLG